MAVRLVLAGDISGDCRHGRLPAALHTYLDTFGKKKIHSMAGSSKVHYRRFNSCYVGEP